MVVRRGAGRRWLGASGSHIVDQVRTWLGEIASVSATLADGRAREPVPRIRSSVRMTMRSGAEVVLQQTAASWTPAWSALAVVAGTDGTIEIDGRRRVVLGSRRAARCSPCPTTSRCRAAPGVSDDPRHRYTHLELGPYTRLCEALRAGVEGRAATAAFRSRRSPTVSRACGCSTRSARRPRRAARSSTV